MIAVTLLEYYSIRAKLLVLALQTKTCSSQTLLRVLLTFQPLMCNPLSKFELIDP